MAGKSYILQNKTSGAKFTVTQQEYDELMANPNRRGSFEIVEEHNESQKIAAPPEARGDFKPKSITQE